MQKSVELPDTKFPDPVLCPKCGATYRKGRWSWADPPAGAARLKCPACRRVEANFPAGEVTLSGAFLAAHRADVLNLVMSREARARKDFPMQRIIDVVEIPEGVRVTTTDGHLARSIALAVHEACKGELDLRFEKDPVYVRAAWSRG
jgi:NMD protein affecting ribosome stability and mRNA decay